jgi:hypothetical protein
MTDHAFDRGTELRNLNLLTGGHRSPLGDYACRMIGRAADAHAAVDILRQQNLEQTALLEAQQATIAILRKPTARLGVAVVEQRDGVMTPRERDLADIASALTDDIDRLHLLLSAALPAVVDAGQLELHRQILATLATSETGATS